LTFNLSIVLVIKETGMELTTNKQLNKVIIGLEKLVLINCNNFP